MASGFLRSLTAVLAAGGTPTVSFDLRTGKKTNHQVEQAITAALQQRFGVSAPSERETFDTKQLAGDFARDFTFEVIIPGAHHAGLTNQALLAILTSAGRPFAEDTPELREHVRSVLLGAFADGTWDEGDAVHIAADAIRDWIIRRVEEQGVDIPLAPLTARYLARKRHQGLDERIGVRKGKWLRSLSRMRVLLE